ncbi:hypothetical protein C8E95_6827 [Pseudonocardia autotrophica]|uniref:HIT domain-containing protein n=1 Tax=Pseudonocardia saturnea TaxID=33909 RepID=A0ABQ0RXF3_9PSEU|nr:hypothetical protein C8E95_6827 [Pseudonocardia autotrophica]BBG01608.1 hypothetical protein Pdca_28170 [Pseudonocardia autotrophica]GEC25353.1 hypothetical protein PSA01_23820 [Pseudonocardia saturnea]
MPDERQLTEDLYGEGAISRRERNTALRAVDRRECVFCDITAGRAPVDLVEDCGNVWIFRPLSPVTPGHVLVVPMAHVVRGPGRRHRPVGSAKAVSNSGRRPAAPGDHPGCSSAGCAR